MINRMMVQQHNMQRPQPHQPQQNGFHCHVLKLNTNFIPKIWENTNKYI